MKRASIRDAGDDRARGIHGCPRCWSAASIAAIVSTAIACALVGCGGQSRHRTGSLRTLTIYAAGPQDGPDRQQTLDAIAAERLALKQIGNRVGPFTVALSELSDSSAATGQWSATQVQANVQKIVDDPTAIAYITDATPGATTEPSTALSDAGVLQVDAGETMRDPAGAGPAPTHQQLVAALGPSAVAEADAQLELMKTQRIRRLLVLSDGTPYGHAISQFVARRAPAFGIELARTRHPIVITHRNLTEEIDASRADAIFFGGLTSTTSIATWNRIASTTPRVKLFGPSGLDTDQFAAATGLLAQQTTFLDEPGPAQADLSPAGQTFVANFTAAYGHAPRPAAFFSYAATQAVLQAIHLAGVKARDRASVAKTFFSLRDVPSVLGTYSIDAAGTATIVPSFIFSTIESGKRIFDRSVVVAP